MAHQSLSGCRPTSEEEVLACIDRHFPNRHASLSLGRGDDCAIFAPGVQLCTSTDLFLENVHFRTAYFEAGDIAYKALAVNISDIAAMGAKPVAFSLAIALPGWVDTDWLEQFFSTMAGLANEHGMLLAGGDISRSESLHISITAFGECLRGHSLLLRGGNMPGDILFLIGDIGLARAGLIELEKHGRKAIEKWPQACRSHLRPAPKAGPGLILGRAAYNSRPPTLMDVSDGLARDLPRLLGHTQQSFGLGATLEIRPDRLHPEVIQHASQTGCDPVMAAFAGGEDYCLLGACAPDLASVLHSAIPGFWQIGEISGPGPVYCNGCDVSAIKGFDHFADTGA